jgi:3-oxoacyl-[acyl-carrier protein] reductase
MGLDGMVALVTGGSRGIGRAVAERFAQLGATVAVQFRADRRAAEETLAGLDGDGHLALQADVADPSQVQALVEQVVDRLGRVDVLVNNAGVYEAHPVLETGYEDWQRIWRRTLETNLLGPANLIHAVAPHMVAGGGGRIVNVSSRGAFRGEPGHPAYGASKAGLNSLGQSMAQALGPHGIYVTHGRARVCGDRHGRPVPGGAGRRRDPRPEPAGPGGHPRGGGQGGGLPGHPGGRVHHRRHRRRQRRVLSPVLIPPLGHGSGWSAG